MFVSEVPSEEPEIDSVAVDRVWPPGCRDQFQVPGDSAVEFVASLSHPFLRLFQTGTEQGLGKLLDYSLELFEDFSGGEFDVQHGSLDVSVSHEFHQSWKRHPGADHVSAERVAKPMRVSLEDAGRTPVMAEQRAKP